MPNTEEAKSLTNLVDKASEHSGVAHESQKSFIGKAVYVKGNISATEDMFVDGRVEGALAAKNSKLEIGVTARIDANAFANIIVIRGEITGDVYADEVIVERSGKINGNIYSSNISMEEGAHFKGSINMEKQDISWEDSIPEIHDDNHEKSSSSFGFLFRRTKNAHADHSVHAHPEPSAPKTAEDVQPISLDTKTHSDCTILGKSVIGRSVLIKGQLESEEDMVIKGEIDGTIYFKDTNLEIGDQAHINGNIFGKNIKVHGKIKGDIYASEHVGIKSPANVQGVIRAPRISIERRAVFMGKVEMEQQKIDEVYAKISTPAAKEKNNFLTKQTSSLENNFEDVKSGVQSVVTPSKSKRVPWPE